MLLDLDYQLSQYPEKEEDVELCKNILESYRESNKDVPDSNLPPLEEETTQQPIEIVNSKPISNSNEINTCYQPDQSVSESQPNPPVVIEVKIVEPNTHNQSSLKTNDSWKENPVTSTVESLDRNKIELTNPKENSLFRIPKIKGTALRVVCSLLNIFIGGIVH